MPEIQLLIDFVGKIGGWGVAMFVGVAVWRGWLILPREHAAKCDQLKKAEDRGDKWEAIALQNMRTASDATKLAHATLYAPAVPSPKD